MKLLPYMFKLQLCYFNKLDHLFILSGHAARLSKTKNPISYCWKTFQRPKCIRNYNIKMEIS
jgi:hypothetical protein